MESQKFLKYAVLILLSSTVLIACSSLSSLQYGKLNTMKDVLNEASVNCGDEGVRSRAITWAVWGIRDLTDSNDYRERESEQYRQAKNLISHLTVVASRRNNNIDILCRNISSAAQATNQYLEVETGQNLASVDKN